MKLGAILSIHVEYDMPDRSLEEARDEICGLLEFIANHAAGEGMLTGDTDLTVEKWWSKVGIIVESNLSRYCSEMADDQ